MSPPLLCVPLLWVLAAGHAGEVLKERAEVHQKLLQQEVILDLLHNQKVQVLEVLELYQRLAQGARQRSLLLEKEMRALRRRVELATFEEALARRALDGDLRRLSPRLLGMYRLTRRNRLEVLLPARDFAALLWRSRAYRTLLEQDLALLEDTRQVAGFQRRALERLDLLKASLGERLDAAQEEAEALRAERAELNDALTLIQAEASHSGRVVQELKVAEAELSRVLEELQTSPTVSGFGALRGKLALPVAGLIEVGFGNVVNPKFNTVTVQRGLDIRAPAGAPVHAVAEGKVVFASSMRGYGNLLIVDHGGGYHTLMAHLAGFSRAVGDVVGPGDVVGQVGDSGSLKGPYLYFEVRQKGLAVDPAAWLEGSKTAEP